MFRICGSQSLSCSDGSVIVADGAVAEADGADTVAGGAVPAASEAIPSASGAVSAADRSVHVADGPLPGAGEDILQLLKWFMSVVDSSCSRWTCYRSWKSYLLVELSLMEQYI